MARFENKVVVITGSSCGIGRITAKKFAKEGAKVFGIARKGQLLKELEAEIRAEGGFFASYCGDLRKAKDAEHIVDMALDKFGRIDILVNNAGALDFASPVATMEDEVWEECIALNLTAPMMTMRKALPYMLKQENGGNIVNVGSVASLRGTISGAAYTASKHGLLGLTKNVAYTYAKQGIRCNLVCPGGVNTYMCSPELREETTARNPETYPIYRNTCSLMIRKSEPEEIANVILFLASKESSVLNGAIVAADSGFTAS